MYFACCGMHVLPRQFVCVWNLVGVITLRNLFEMVYPMQISYCFLNLKITLQRSKRRSFLALIVITFH